MKPTKVYDLPTRLLHWLFAGTFVVAFLLAKTLDDDSPYFSFHMLLGFVLAAIVLLRVVWGIIGTRYARFSSFALSPGDLIRYFQLLIGPKPSRTLGHNPASSWAALLMMGMALGLAVTGYLMTTGGNKELLEDLHELLANAFATTAILHVAGVSFHSLRHRDAIGLAMVSGKKDAVPGEVGIQRSHRGVGLLFASLIAAFVFHLGQSYDSGTQTLNLLGNTLRLGESEGGEGGQSERGERHEGHEENERDDD